MDLDDRRVGHAQDGIVVEVALHGASILHRDLTGQRRARRPNDGALDLRAHRVGIDDRTAVEGAHDAIDADAIALADRHLGDFGDIGAVVIEESDAAAASLR